MARVPLQNTPQVGLETGSAPQFTGGTIEPVQDTVTDDLQKSSQAQRNVANIAIKLQEEYNDVESKKLYNDFYGELQNNTNNYLNTRGYDAIKTVDKDSNNSQYDLTSNNNYGLMESYAEKASNSQIKFLFENMASVSLKSAENKMTQHSIKQQRVAHENEVEAAISIFTNEAKNNTDYNNPDGEFIKHYAAGLRKIEEKAILKGWNIDPEATGPDGNKLGISDQYIQEINEYNMEVYKALIDNLTEDTEWKEIEELFIKLNPVLNPKDKKDLQAKVEKKHSEHNQGVIVDTIIANNSNQNNARFLDQANTIFGLSSNNTTSNGSDGSVVDGFNTDDTLIDLTGTNRSERIELLQQIRNRSIFYKEDATKTLIPQHQTTHLYSIVKVGLKKADSLYTRAEREYKASIPIPKKIIRQRAKTGNREKYIKEFLDNPDNFKIVNEGILDRYNELVLAEFRRRNLSFYQGTRKVFRENTVKRSDFGDSPSEQRKFNRARARAKRNPENYDEIDVNKPIPMSFLGPFVGTPQYEGLQNQMIYNDKVANDQQVLKNNIDYDYNPDTDETVIVNEITGLQPKNVLVKKIKDTIKDKDELDYALKDLDIKYEKIKNNREGIYNKNFIAAKLIAQSEKGGVALLAENNINIDNFTEQDQKILKDGQPEESDDNTVVELINNPEEIATNLETHSHKLSNGQYQELKRYAASLRSEKAVVEATGNITMLKATLDRYDMGNLHRNRSKKNNIKYLAIHDAWLKEINARQISNNNTKLTMGDKQKALNYVLLTDLVSVDRRFGRDRTDVIPATVEFDNLQNVFVDVLFEGQNVKVFTSKINPEVSKLIQKSIRDKNKFPTQALIAEYWLKAGKPENETQARENLKNYGLTN